MQELDRDTLLLLFGLFIVIAGIRTAGVIDAAAQLFHTVAGEDPFRLYVLLVVVSVVLSAFIDNIPYVATMLPVVQGIAALMNNGAGMAPEVFLLRSAHRRNAGRQPDPPIGASANIAAIGILRKNGETVRTADFLRIGVPFTLAAVLTGSVYLWLVWGRALNNRKCLPPAPGGHAQTTNKPPVLCRKTGLRRAFYGSMTFYKKRKVFLQKTLDNFGISGIITIVPSDTAHEQKQNMRIWRNWQTR